MMINKQQIESFLPHRSPFLFVDSIEDIILPHGKCEGILKKKDTVGIEVVAGHGVRRDHVIFDGHFPSNPILPGVIQIEMMAQVAGFTMFYCFENHRSTNIRMALLSVHNAKFRKPIIPDMDVVIKAKAVRVKGSMVTHKAFIFNSKENFSVRPKQCPSLIEKDEEDTPDGHCS